MKKNYFFALLCAFGVVSANAQFAADDMESYGGGDTPILENHWGSWDGTTGPALLSSGAQAQSGALSGWVNDDPTTGVDALMLLGDKIFGPWGVSFSLYIPAGKEGYMNMQGVEAPGIQFVVGNWYYNQDGLDPGNGNISDTALGAVTFAYPEAQWFDVIMNFDFESGASAATWELWIDGANVIPAGTDYSDGAGTFAQTLGAIDLYAISAGNEMYIDDVEYINDYYVLGTEDFDAKGFSAYPNPVNNVLNLSAKEAISSVAIYNVLGQEVYSANVNALNTTVDTSSFTSGAYFVKVNVGGTEGTVKILK